MRNKVIFLLAIVMVIAATSCQQNGAVKNVKLETAIDSASYAIGILVGSNNKQQLANAPGGEDMNIEAMSAAFRAISLGEETPITEEEANTIIRNYFQAEGNKEAQVNLEKGNAFLEKNKAREGVVTTESGLQYEILKEGNGPKPNADDQVKVNYHGTLIDGTVFDSSVDRGEPVTFGVSQVIPGWTEALKLMPVGSKWKLYIPANLAYGERGAGSDIGPNETLIFEVELLDIVNDDSK
ncbi:MAG TPA: FKBP-type peptidyl-prolyl cis-trans isomerase [Draconibacterium sp.]|nr:FKBP-type peptidyl-prolyl cis-trans isomerase [Draconibacterium sp.]